MSEELSLKNKAKQIAIFWISKKESDINSFKNSKEFIGIIDFLQRRDYIEL